MFQHIGLLTLDPGATPEQRTAIVAGLRALVGTVPGLRAAHTGLDAALREHNADLYFRMEFDDEAAWRGYGTHPAHVAVLTDLIAPVLREKTFVQLRDPEEAV